MFGSLKIDGQERGMWWDNAWGGGGLPRPPLRSALLAHYKSNDGYTLTQDQVDPVKVDPAITLGNVNCAGFNGSSSSISVPASIQGTGSGTILAWVEAIDQGGYDEYVSSADGTDFVRLMFHDHSSMKRPYFNTSIGNSGAASLGSAWVDGSMKLVAGIWEKSGGDTVLSVYLPFENFYESSTVAGSIPAIDNGMTIGKRDNASSSFITGAMSNVMYFDRALTTAEIDAFSFSDPYAHFPLAEEDTAVAYDVSARRNHGTKIDVTNTQKDNPPCLNLKNGAVKWVETCLALTDVPPEYYIFSPTCTPA